MFRNLFFAAILAAICAGLAFAAVQQWRLVPLIVAAESFEGAAEPHVHDTAAAVEAHAHDHGADEWMPQDGFERTAYTVLASLLAAAGFALVIGAVSVIIGVPITAANGILWALGGFAAFSLAPAFGLPPGLPTMPVAETLNRQIWWWGTAIATGSAILLFARVRAPWALAVAAVLVALPHVIGAPQPPVEPTDVPAGIAAAFAASVLFTNAMMWVILGLAMGFASDWLARRGPAAAIQPRTA